MSTGEHLALVKIAEKWLRSTRRCFPIFCESTSCSESPDAIGWNPRGSIVVECKTSVRDLQVDGNKYVRFNVPNEPGYYIRPRLGRGIKELVALGYERSEDLRMGNQRYILCYAGILSTGQVAKYAPDYGLLWATRKIVRVINEAPRRKAPDLNSEIRLLRLHWGQRFYDENRQEIQPNLFEEQSVEVRMP